MSDEMTVPGLGDAGQRAIESMREEVRQIRREKRELRERLDAAESSEVYDKACKYDALLAEVARAFRKMEARP